ncbi:MAG TPA: PUR family DNA/RNA-binding protein [Candidatus Avibacteroides faecavium]|nr:PUR family DNA/RNA-binding protein [Candidatus Avibacteroides faecavium]
MEDLTKKSAVEANDKDIIFSKSIKAGKRIYYLDVKKNRKDELFLAITESKKVMVGYGDEAHLNFEKHKIFLYREDFEKFTEGLRQVIDYINEQSGDVAPTRTVDDNSDGAEEEKEDNLKFDISFE